MMDSTSFPTANDYLGIDDEDMQEQNRMHMDSAKSGPFREQDIYLPIANVARIMKNAVPANGKIAKEAKECVQECVSEFISFITSEASERCAQEKRKTINGEDVLFAMATLGFDPYIEPLKLYLQAYRDSLKADKGLGEYPDGHVSLEQELESQFEQQNFTNILVTSGESAVPAVGAVYTAQMGSYDG